LPILISTNNINLFSINKTVNMPFSFTAKFLDFKRKNLPSLLKDEEFRTKNPT